MVSVHELAALPDERSGEDPELLPGASSSQIKVIRCPVCKGLRGVFRRHATRLAKTCDDCKRGKVIYRSQYHNYWTKRFTHEEIMELAGAIWGD